MTPGSFILTLALRPSPLALLLASQHVAESLLGIAGYSLVFLAFLFVLAGTLLKDPR